MVLLIEIVPTKYRVKLLLLALILPLITPSLKGILGTEQVAAQTIILQIASLSFMIPLGTGIATSSLVGNAIGGWDIRNRTEHCMILS